MSGFSIYLCIGKYGGFGIRFDGPVLRVVCGYVSFAVILRDIEQDMQSLMDLSKASNGRQ